MSYIRDMLIWPYTTSLRPLSLPAALYSIVCEVTICGVLVEIKTGLTVCRHAHHLATDPEERIFVNSREFH